MKQKIFLLMLVIPLILILTIFAVSETVSLSIDIPVSGIEVTSFNIDNECQLDLATYNNDYYFKANVYPKEAKNRDYTIAVESDDASTIPVLDIDEDGKVTLNRTGDAIIKATSNDKGFKTSLKLSVYSSKVYDLNIQAKDIYGNNIEMNKVENEDYDYEIPEFTTGEKIDFRSLVYPSSLNDEPIVWTVSDEDALHINSETGVCDCILTGSYVVTATINDSINGVLQKKIKINLVRNEGLTKFSVNGKNSGDSTTILISPNKSEMSFIVESDCVLTTSDFYFDTLGSVVSVTALENKTNVYKVVIKFDALTIGNSFNFYIQEFGKANKFNVQVLCKDHAIGIVNALNKDPNGSEAYQKVGQSIRYSVYIDPYEEGSIKWEVSGDATIIGDDDQSFVNVIGDKEGNARLKVTYVVDGKIYENEKEIHFVEGVINPSFKGNLNNSIKGINAYGDTKLVNGKYVLNENQLSITSLKDGQRQNCHFDKFIIDSSDENILKIDDEGKFNIVSTGVVDITARWKYNENFNGNIETTIKLEVVKGGVVVENSKDLEKAAKDGRPIVLNKDIMFAEGYSRDQINNLLSNNKYETTYDWTYYNNIGTKHVHPTVSFILEFKANVYGNGHKINTELITKAYDGNNPRYFKGPLNFVGVDQLATVKGQDNISFLVREDDVVLDNVCLMGCEDSKLMIVDKDGESRLDLSQLNYVGTVLEIAGDDFKLINSRVKNGRNVVRAYGGGADSNGSPIINRQLTIDEIKNEKIDVLIESSILSNGREFILKQGANRAIICNSKGQKEDFKPVEIMDSKHNPYEYKNKLFDKTNDEFYNNVILVDLTLKNCVLDTSGLFTIGIESHFTGPFLAGNDDQFGDQLKRYGWHDLAATSYGTLLRFEGDVRLYDWKDVSLVDSSSLIESIGNAGETLSKIIRLDIGNMISKVNNLSYKEQYADYANIILEKGNKQFVHGGIAFYGGGKNYSKIDFSKFKGCALSKYDINISVLAEDENKSSDEYLQGTMLPLAAGYEDFTFYMYDKNSAFDYEKQMASLKDGSAYSWINGVV